MSTNEELVRRIEALEAATAELHRTAASRAKPKRLNAKTRTRMFNGFPQLCFYGEFRPFSLSLKKATMILERIDDVRVFVESHGE